MAHFRATVSGGRGSASRLGHKTSGIGTSTDGWNLGVDVFGRYNKEDNRDEFTITVNGGSNGGGQSKVIGTFYRDGESIRRVEDSQVKGDCDVCGATLGNDSMCPHNC